MKYLSIIFALITFFSILACEENNAELKLSASAERAVKSYTQDKEKIEQRYLDDMKRIQDRLKENLTREIKNMRLTEQQEKLMDQIMTTEDEKVKSALLALASDEVKNAIAVKKYYDKLTNNGVVTDILGNIIKPTQNELPHVVGTWLMTYTMNGKITHTRTVSIDKDLNMTLIEGTFGGGTDVLTYDEKTKTYTGSGKTAEDTYNFETLTGVRTNGSVTHKITIKKIK